MARSHAHGVDFWRVHYTTGTGWYAEGPYAYERTARRQINDRLRYTGKSWASHIQSDIYKTGKVQKLIPVSNECDLTLGCSPGLCFGGHGIKLDWVDVE